MPFSTRADLSGVNACGCCVICLRAEQHSQLSRKQTRTLHSHQAHFEECVRVCGLCDSCPVEERCTPHYMVPISPQCPQEIILPTLPVFQGAAVSRERFSQSPPGNVAVLRGSLPLRRSLEQLDQPSPAGPPLQGTKLAALSIPEASLERLIPLVGHLVV